MKLPEYGDSKKIEEDSIPAWLVYLNNFRVVRRAYYVDDKKTQLEDHCDIDVICYGKKHPFRVDVKTRDSHVYDWYQKDGLIFVEVDGNTEKDKGSEIYNTCAEVWGYGFWVNGHLLEPFLFKCQEFAKWLKPIEHKFEQKFASTGDHHTTRGVLVPKYLFLPFLLEGF